MRSRPLFCQEERDEEDTITFYSFWLANFYCLTNIYWTADVSWKLINSSKTNYSLHFQISENKRILNENSCQLCANINYSRGKVRRKSIHISVNLKAKSVFYLRYVTCVVFLYV